MLPAKLTSQKSNDKIKQKSFETKLEQQIRRISQPISNKTTRFSILEGKLGLKMSSRSDRFESVFKEFKGLDTFFTITELLQELNTTGVDPQRYEIQRDKIKHLLEQEKLIRWKTQFPQHLEFETGNRYQVQSELLRKTRSRFDLQKFEPKLYETVHNLKPYLKSKFQNIDLREHPQLQLFKEITDLKPLEAITQSQEENEEKIDVQALNQMLQNTHIPEDYSDQYQQEAENLRLRLRQQQLQFFNQKWGNSRVKMKIKEQQFKRQSTNFRIQKVSIKKDEKEIKKKNCREIITDPFMKDIISDICYEEADMMEQKREIKHVLQEMEQVNNQFFSKYQDPEIIGIRMTTK